MDQPATDLAWLLNGAGRSLRAALIDRLDLDAQTIDRADLRHRLGPWCEVIHGLDEDSTELVASGLSGVRDRLR